MPMPEDIEILKVAPFSSWGCVNALDKIFGILLIHDFGVIFPCPLICELCRFDPNFT
jgi:hypothetical protein